MTTTPTIPQTQILYKGFRIDPVFHYKTLHGQYLHSDFNVFPENDENGWMAHCQTLDEVKQNIDDLID